MNGIAGVCVLYTLHDGFDKMAAVVKLCLDIGTALQSILLYTL